MFEPPQNLLPPPELVQSRFLAKVALESMAKRLAAYPEGLEYLVDESQLDLLRNHARRGTSPRWQTNVRRIYDANGRTFDVNGPAVQVIHESDFLVTEQGEWFFVLALFGVELAINLGGPDISGYVQWLYDNRNASPLYHGKNTYGQPKPSAVLV
jgi:hypothetical protein